MKINVLARLAERIIFLKQELKALEKRLESESGFTREQVRDLKKQRLSLKDGIAVLTSKMEELRGPQTSAALTTFPDIPQKPVSEVSALAGKRRAGHFDQGFGT